MAQPAEDQFTAGRTNLSETAKWLIGGIVTLAVGVLAGAPLTHLGSVSSVWRLLAIAGAAAVTYGLLGHLLWLAIAVIAADSITIAGLAEATGEDAALVRSVEARVAGVFPQGVQTFQDLVRRSGEIMSAGPARERKRFLEELAQFEPIVSFQFKLVHFKKLKTAVFRLMPLVIGGIFTFAWAANPPEEKVLSSAPHYARLPLSAATLARLAPAVKPECYPSVNGRAEILAMIVYQLDGRTDEITLPAIKGCEPVRLTLQNGDIFIAK